MTDVIITTFFLTISSNVTLGHDGEMQHMYIHTGQIIAMTITFIFTIKVYFSPIVDYSPFLKENKNKLPIEKSLCVEDSIYDIIAQDIISDHIK